MMDPTDWSSILEEATDATVEEVERVGKAIALLDSQRRVTWIEELSGDPWWRLGEDDEPRPFLRLVRTLETGADDILRMPIASTWNREGFPHVTRLELTGAPEPRLLRRALWRLPRVATLDLTRALIATKSTVELLASLPPLPCLEFRAVGPAPRAFEALRRSEAAAALRFLDLAGNWAVGEQIEHLATLALRGLDLSKNRIGLDELLRLEGTPLGRSLEYLDLRETGLENAESRLKAVFPSLRTLTFDGVSPTIKPIGEQMAEGWAGRVALWTTDPECFWFDGATRIDPRWTSGAERPTAIATSVDGLLEIADTSRLSEVERWSMLADSSAKATAQAFARLPRLEDLDLGECVTNHFNAFMGRLPAIRGLTLRFRILGSRTIQNLLKSAAGGSLRRLDGSRCFWSKEAISLLKELELEELSLRDAVLPLLLLEEVFRPLRDSRLFRSLRRLDLRGNARHSATWLRDAVPELLIDDEPHHR